jgi:hypothetical protein
MSVFLKDCQNVPVQSNRNNPSFLFLAACLLSLAVCAAAPAWTDYPIWGTRALAAQPADPEAAIGSKAL